MNRLFGLTLVQAARGIGAACGAALVLALLSGAIWGATPTSASPGPARAQAPQAAPQATPGQDFQDVTPDNPFYPFLHSLYRANIISGYGCGGTNPPEPCVPPTNLPYYRPGASVTRLQMTKFIDNGRRNIGDAIGNSLYISTTAAAPLWGITNSGGAGVQGQCVQSGNGCFASVGFAEAGDLGGFFYGGQGMIVGGSDASTYGTQLGANAYRAAGIKTDSTNFYSLYVDAPPGPPTSTTFAAFNTSVNIAGNLSVSGSKGGYVVDLMQNAGTDALEVGDVVSIVGNAPAVLGEIPVVTIKKATGAYDTAVAGVVDQIMAVPSAQTRAAYLAQEQARRTALDRRTQLEAAARGQGHPADLSDVPVPPALINDVDGNVHVDATATSAGPRGYANIVTLGAYKAVKVDAGFGAIHAGDLLTTSPHAGYAMKVTDKVAAIGAIIGKALGDLPSGAGTLPILVMPK